MLAILPYLCLVLLILKMHQSMEESSWRVSILRGGVIWGLLITALTETLSLFNTINFQTLLICWIGINGILVFLLIRTKMSILNHKENFPRIKLFQTTLIAGVVFIITVVGVTAFIYPPNTWDSMTYHMSRVMHWVQNQSVEFYPTSNLRQLYLAPWAEYAILHLQILNNGDLFANSIQWLSLLGSVIGVSLIARELGASKVGQALSAVIAATVPMGILQGSSTQTDLTVAFWLACFVYFLMVISRKPALISVLGAGGALGLAILTKATAYLYALPFLFFFVIWLFVKKFPRKWIILVTLSSIVILVNVAHLYRNYSLFRNPLGPSSVETGFVMENEVFSIQSVASNLLKNTALHLTTPFDNINRFIEKVINKLHKIMNFQVNDERTTWPGTTFSVNSLTRHEDTAGNPWHFILILFCFVLVLVQRQFKNIVGVYLLLVLSAFILMSGYLKWQPWNSRLHLPLFILFSASGGVILQKALNRYVYSLIVLVFVILAIPYLFQNRSRPLADINLVEVSRSRETQYFNNRPDLYPGYDAAGVLLQEKNCRKVGIILGGDDFEYPLWMILQKKLGNSFVIEHGNVSNISSSLKDSASAETMCAIFSRDPNPQKTIRIASSIYFLALSMDSSNVYLP